jgi:hypothetical protein
LVFHIQTADQPPFANAQINRSRVDFVDVGLGNTLPTAPGSGWVSDQLDGKYHRATLIDNSFVYNAQPEYFQVVTKRGIITGDHWHHLLLSFDLAGYMSVGQPNPTSTCQLWYAIDDVDYRGADNLRPFRDTGDGMDDNNIVSNNVYTISGGAPGSALYENQFVPPATGTYGPAIVPSSDAALGLPASAAYVDRIYAVEMAELQVFTGVSLDTKDEASRRAFITKDGTPADPLKKPNPPPPVPLPAGWVPPLKGPQELLGKEADILLHGSGNWIAGNNTGKAIKLNEIGKPSAVPAENLVSTGSIVAYSPDPSLHGVQSPPPPKPAIQQHATVR